MIANNSLSSNARDNIEALKRGYIPSDDGYLLIYYHNSECNPMLLEIKQGDNGSTLVDTLYKFPERNSASTSSITQALKVATTLCPANEYGLILWSHATGWLPEGYYTSGGTTTSAINNNSNIKMSSENSKNIVQLSFGSEDNKEIEITALTKALPHRYSYIIFDACLMGGIETAYELKDSTDYILFSPTEILATGFPYSRIMKHLFAKQTDLKSVAEEYFNYYNSQYGIYQSATITLINTSKLENVANIAKDVFSTSRDKIQQVNMDMIQPYFRGNKHWFYDIQDLIDNIGTPEQSSTFKSALNEAIIYKAHTDHFLELPINRYSGLSTYIPNPSNEFLDNYYKNFAWNKVTEMIN
jgi:Clostripain family.